MTVLQLLSNWIEWYGTQPACAGFEKAGDMLRDDQFELPPAAPASKPVVVPDIDDDAPFMPGHSPALKAFLSLIHI